MNKLTCLSLRSNTTMESGRTHWPRDTAQMTWGQKLALVALLLGLIVIKSANVAPVEAAQTVQRPLSDFLSAQGTTEHFQLLCSRCARLYRLDEAVFHTAC
jgi:hypothetical protein